MNKSQLRLSADGGTRHLRAGWFAGLALATAFAGGCSRDGGRKHATRGSDQPATARLIQQALGDAGAKGKNLRFAGGDTLRVGPSAVSFYRGRGWGPAWTDEHGLTDAGRALVSQLARTGDDGLSPERYHYSDIRRLTGALEAAKKDGDRAAAAANIDIMVSEGFARYADDLAAGTLDPAQAGLEWHLAKEHAPKTQALQRLAGGTDPAAVVQELRPHTVAYTRMMQALARYRGVAARGGWPLVGKTMAATASVSASTSATATGPTAALRARLLASDDSTEAALAASGRAAPGTMDVNLKSALAHFQKRNGLPVDGRLGAKTLEALNTPVQDRIRTLALNLDRLRWLPRDLGPFYVLVNLPAMKVNVMEGDRSVMEQKVVVGKPGWNTPVFADRMVQLIVNPYWNVPKSIVAEELGPELASNPNYLAEHNFEQTSEGGYRQLPGDKNSLGRFKFQLTNDEDIYLHDTPAKSAFGKDDRDLSHGCVRLQDARAMAMLIGARQGISAETIDRLYATGTNHVLDFKTPVPTYIMYFTAAVEPDGTIAFYPDVYNIDARMANLMPALEGRPLDRDTIARDSAVTADSLKSVKASHAGKATD